MWEGPRSIPEPDLCSLYYDSCVWTAPRRSVSVLCDHSASMPLRILASVSSCRRPSVCSYARAICRARSTSKMPHAAGSGQSPVAIERCCFPDAAQTRHSSRAFGSMSASGGTGNSNLRTSNSKDTNDCGEGCCRRFSCLVGIGGRQLRFTAWTCGFCSSGCVTRSGCDRLVKFSATIYYEDREFVPYVVFETVDDTVVTPTNREAFTVVIVHDWKAASIRIQFPLGRSYAFDCLTDISTPFQCVSDEFGIGDLVGCMRFMYLREYRLNCFDRVWRKIQNFVELMFGILYFEICTKLHFRDHVVPYQRV